MSRSQESKGSGLRGKRLKARIRAVIIELAATARREGRKYRFNASEVARLIPTTRKTLARHDDFIDEVLRETKSDRRMAFGFGELEAHRKSSRRLKQKLADVTAELEALRACHLQIFSLLYEESVDLSKFSKLVNIEKSDDGNVVSISRRR